MEDKLYGLVYGCAIGDALGLQYEGCDREYIAGQIANNPAGLTIKTEGSWYGIELGDWTDDTDQLVLLMETLTETDNKFDTHVLAKKLKHWRYNGFVELGDKCGMGLGQYTGKITAHPNFEKDPIDTSRTVYEQLGSNRAANGALMRAGIAAFATNWMDVSMLQCKTTHYDQRCVKSCIVLVYICRCFIHGRNINWQIIKDILTDFPYWTELDLPASQTLLALKLDDEDRGYTYKSLACALYVAKLIRTDIDFKQILCDIILCGGDTDTNCAIVGQVLGAYLGYAKLPKDLIVLLKHTTWLNNKICSYKKIIT